MKNKKQTKSQFIRSHGNASAVDVVAAGKKAGLPFSVAYVYSVRTAANRAKKEASKKKERTYMTPVEANRPLALPKLPEASSKKSADSSELLEEKLVLIAQLIGFQRAGQVLGAAREKALKEIEALKG